MIRSVCTITMALVATMASAHNHHHHHHNHHVYVNNDNAHIPRHLHAHDHLYPHEHHEHRVLSDATTPAYKCPACRMSTAGEYNNAYYVELKNGQRVYTCGMDPRTFPDYDFSVTDVSYVAANMAQYVVNKTATKEFETCKNECPECANGIKDPVSGDAISTENFRYVCLKDGQKIYFASDKTRDEYLSNVNQKPRYLVDKIMCNTAECADATKITQLSAAAANMKPDLSTGSSAGSGSSTPASKKTTTTTTTTTSNGFCTGKGSVMLNGFQSTINGACVRLFFQPFVLNSALKYTFGFLGVFAMAIFNEYLVKFREQVRQSLIAVRKERPNDKWHRQSCKLLLAFLYMCQMTIAYFAMLVVMMYETGLFIALILGFGAGFLLFKNLDMDVTQERGVWRYTDPSTICLRIGGMSCMKNCGSTVEAALQQVQGVSKAVVIFEEHCAYVAGTADVQTLVDAVEAVGFSAEAASASMSQRV